MNTKKIPWKKLRENVYHKPLARDEEKNLQIDIIKLEPNIQYKEHLHPDIEWVYILKGSMSDENGNYNSGDFIINQKNSKHTVTAGENGCEILCFWCGEVKPT
jgi:anti-sigma factor ChrR (cupin superfamily)